MAVNNRWATSSRSTELLQGYVAGPRLSGAFRSAFQIAILVGVGVTGVVDVVTGQAIALDVLYVLPVVVAAARISRRFGLIVAVESATAWVLVNRTERPTPAIGTSIEAEVLRVTILFVIAAIVSALHDALVTTQASERRSKDFLSFAAHQIRTPLAGLRTCTESLLLSGVTAQQEPLLAHVAIESERMGRLLTSMLRLARLDQGEAFRTELVDLAALCRAAIGSAHRAADASVTTHLHCDGTVEIVTSSEAIQEALTNLFDNALRHALMSVEATITSTPNAVTLIVEDDGPGLPPGTEEHAFERFVSLDGRGGSGLGLAIARALVDGMSGSLIYRNRQFVMTLPNITSISDDKRPARRH
jgi:signal transduction histidine kinase